MKHADTAIHLESLSLHNKALLLAFAAYGLLHHLSVESGFLSVLAAAALMGALAFIHALPLMSLRRVLSHSTAEAMGPVLAALTFSAVILSHRLPWPWFFALLMAFITAGLLFCVARAWIAGFWGLTAIVSLMAIPLYGGVLTGAHEILLCAGVAGLILSRLGRMGDRDIGIYLFFAIAVTYGETILAAAERALR